MSTIGHWTQASNRASARTGNAVEHIPVCESSLRRLYALILGEQLAELRRYRCMTRQTLAERMRVSRAHVARIECGMASNVDEVRTYVTALNGSIQAFPDGSGYAVAVSPEEKV